MEKTGLSLTPMCHLALPDSPFLFVYVQDMCIHVHVHIEATGRCLVFFSVTVPYYLFLEKGPLTEPRARLAVSDSPRSPPPHLTMLNSRSA